MWTAGKKKKKLKLWENCLFFFSEQMLLGDSSPSSKEWLSGSMGWLRKGGLTRKFVKGGIQNYFLFPTPLFSSVPCRIFCILMLCCRTRPLLCTCTVGFWWAQCSGVSGERRMPGVLSTTGDLLFEASGKRASSM